MSEAINKFRNLKSRSALETDIAVVARETPDCWCAATMNAEYETQAERFFQELPTDAVDGERSRLNQQARKIYDKLEYVP